MPERYMGYAAKGTGEKGAKTAYSNEKRGYDGGKNKRKKAALSN